MKTETIAHALAELGNQTRLEIFRLLIKVGRDGMTIGEIGKRLQIPPSTLGFHLKGLISARLVSQEKQGRSVICRAELDTITSVINELVAECCIEEKLATKLKEDAA